MLLSPLQKPGRKGDIGTTEISAWYPCLGQGSLVGGVQPADPDGTRVESQLHFLPAVQLDGSFSPEATVSLFVFYK